MINLYWPIYKNLEREVLELSNQIHFDDNQLNVYSVKISELLLRCVVEIEAIAKDLYFKNGGKNRTDRDLYFDTNCLDFLENKWLLSKKVVIVSAANFYFQQDENKILTPLKKANKRGTSAADWEKAYQAVKHNRTMNLTKGNIKYLIRAMGALFLLNLYYKNDIVELANSNSGNFADDLSELFHIKVHKWCGDKNEVKVDSYLKKEDFEECTYLIKWTNDYKTKWSELIIEQGEILRDLVFNHPKVNSYINENLIEDGKIKQDKFVEFFEKQEYFKYIDMKTEFGSMVSLAMQKASKKLSFNWEKVSFEAVLNINQQVYDIKSN